MSYLKEQVEWADGIYQIETSDPVLDGPDGITNRPARELADRTAWLKKQLADRTAWLKKQLKEAEAALTTHTRSRNHPDASLSEKVLSSSAVLTRAAVKRKLQPQKR